MEWFKNYLSKRKGKELNLYEIANILLYAIIVIMPFIVNKELFPVYVVGKMFFIYVIVVLLTLILIRTHKYKGMIEDKYTRITVLFILSIFVSVILSPYKKIALWGNIYRGEGLIMLISYIILFNSAYQYLKIKEKYLDFMLVVSNVMAIYGIFQFYFQDPIQVYLQVSNLSGQSIGTIGNRNFLSTYLCLFLFISMAMYIFKGKIKYLIFSTPLFAALLCTLTRSGWVAFIVYSTIGFILIIKRKDCLIRSIIVLFVFIVTLTTINISSGNKIYARADKSVIVSEDGELNGSASSRVNILKISFRALLDKPLLGYGPDTLRYRLTDDYPDEFMLHTIEYNEVIDKSHNEFLEYAVSCGIFTLVFYLLLIGFILFGLFKRISDDKSKIMVLVLIGYLVQSFFNISVVMVAPLYWIFLGACVKYINEN